MVSRADRKTCGGGWGSPALIVRYPQSLEIHLEIHDILVDQGVEIGER